MNSRKSFFTGLVLFLCTFSVCGQITGTTEAVQREVSHEISAVRTFKIPCDVEFEDLSSLDFVYLELKPALIRKTKLVINNNWMSIVHTYPQMPRYERDYEFQMGKSVTDRWGTRLYYHNGEEYYNLSNEEENEIFQISSEKIAEYGFFNGLFDVSIDEIQAFSDSTDIPLYILGQKILSIYTDSNQRTETEMDLDQLYIETRLYRDNIHVLTDRAEYQRTENDWIIPAKKVHIYYSELPSQTRYQITQVETYLSYKVIDENNEILVNIENNADSFAISVSPNPATDNITVHFSIPIKIDGEVINLKIMNVENDIVWEETLTAVLDELNINISHFEPGLYTLCCTYNNKTAQANFLKEGIGQYTVPVEIDIQIFPNPVHNQITVHFPQQIDAVMNVKIIDITGNKYLDLPRYIQGNELQINNLNHLPAGIYYIFCTNSEWTGYTQFLKQ